MAHTTIDVFNDIEPSDESSEDSSCESPESNRRKKPYMVAPVLGSVSGVKSKFNKAMEHADDIREVVIETTCKPIKEHVTDQNNNKDQHPPAQSDHPQTSQTNHILSSISHTILSINKLAVVGVVVIVAVIIVLSGVTPVMIRNKQKPSDLEKSSGTQTVLPINTSSSSTQTSSLTTTVSTSTTTTLITTICPNISCSINSSVQNPSLNYQVERLDINCTQSLTNLTIIQIVQRANNETHAQQYQTFWNQTTNMTYIESQTDITYIWYILPNMIINETTFPHFIEAQYYYGSNSGRITVNDTWHVSLQSICGYTLTSFGTF